MNKRQRKKLKQKLLKLFVQINASIGPPPEIMIHSSDIGMLKKLGIHPDLIPKEVRS